MCADYITRELLTEDALFDQRPLTEFIIVLGKHYLPVVKKNHHDLCEVAQATLVQEKSATTDAGICEKKWVRRFGLARSRCRSV